MAISLRSCGGRKRPDQKARWIGRSCWWITATSRAPFRVFAGGIDYMYDVGLMIGGGSNNIQKNIISERGLDLPREPKVCKGLANGIRPAARSNACSPTFCVISSRTDWAIETARSLAETGSGFDATLWKGLCELGLPGLLVPERFGGAGLGVLDAAVAAEVLGAAATPTPFAGSIVMATLAFIHGATEAQQDEFLHASPRASCASA